MKHQNGAEGVRAYRRCYQPRRFVSLANELQRERDRLEGTKPPPRRRADLATIISNIFFSASLSAATIALAVFTHRLWVSTDELVDFAARQDRDMKTSLGIAIDAADAAKESAFIARQALHLSQRPQMHTSDWLMTTFDRGAPADFEFKIINSGPTGADVTDVIVKWHVGTMLPTTPDYSSPIKNPPSMISAGGFLLIDPPDGIPVTEIDYDDIMMRNKSLFLYGRASFTDVFEEEFEIGFARRLQIVSVGPPMTRQFVFPDATGYNYVRPKPKASQSQ